MEAISMKSSFLKIWAMKNVNNNKKYKKKKNTKYKNLDNNNKNEFL